MIHKICVESLPTNDETCVYNDIDDILCYQPNKLKQPDNLHIYVTVSQDIDPIREGDWFYYPMMYMGGIKHFVAQYDLSKHHTILSKKCAKIIASTDPELINDGFRSDTKTLVAELPQSFLKEFVANPSAEWEVEYAIICIAGSSYHGDYDLKFKLNSDNTIDINLVEEKMLPLSKVKQLCRNAMFTGELFGRNPNLQTPLGKGFDEICNNWIKENL